MESFISEEYVIKRLEMKKRQKRSSPPLLVSVDLGSSSMREDVSNASPASSHSTPARSTAMIRIERSAAFDRVLECFSP
ncbi:hypothetical protein HPP92_021575 [Vanilla planifolia]|nr:hypothetical protein HPP92_021575 [Vanilla planifolia]